MSASSSPDPAAIGLAFRAAVEGFDPAARPLILGHFDADGLSAIAILARALERFGRAADVRVIGRGENPWLPPVRDWLAQQAPGGLLVADLGVRDGELGPGVHTILVDHHRCAATLFHLKRALAAC